MTLPIIAEELSDRERELKQKPRQIKAGWFQPNSRYSGESLRVIRAERGVGRLPDKRFIQWKTKRGKVDG